MKPLINIQSDKIEISIPISAPIEDVKKWKELIDNLLSIFLNRKVDIITIEPQKYSIGYEIANGEKYSSGKNKYLINRDIILTIDLLKLVTESEDFERGLLLIVLSGNPTSIIEHLSKLDESSEELIVLDDDGKSFNWYNPSSESEIKSLRNLL